MKLRKRKGNTICEFGPCMGMCMVMLAPSLDVMGLSIDYGAGWFVNFSCTRELAVHKQAEGEPNGGTVAAHTDAAFRESCFAQVLKLKSKDDSDGRIKHQVTYTTDDGSGTTTSSAMPDCIHGRVIDKTEVISEPLISICLPCPVPGFSAPMTFTYTSEATREETR